MGGAQGASAFQAREEWLPIRRPDPDDARACVRRVALGKLADIFLIDTRTRRDEPVPEPAMSSRDRTALGPEQRDWLSETLDESTATWRLLGNPSVMSPAPGGPTSRTTLVGPRSRR